MVKRPLVVCGAAFLLTVAAALFAPSGLLAITIPCAFLVALAGFRSRIVTSVALGCLAALVCCAFFAERESRAAALCGHSYPLTGVVYKVGNRQFLYAKLPEGGQLAFKLFPQIPDAVSGDVVSATLAVTSTARDSDTFMLTRGILLEAVPSDAQLLPPGSLPIPFVIKTMIARAQLTDSLAKLNPSPATSVTLGVMFSHKDGISPQTRDNFSKSGLAHLLAASGLHLSILIYIVLGAVRGLGGGKRIQAVSGALCAVPLFFGVGMSISALRAAIMSVLGFCGGAINRKSDGLTSLTAAAVVITAICPPAMAELSFQLSFLSVLGILLVAPRLTRLFREAFTARFGSCGRFGGWVLGSLAVSLSAQLFTAPLVGLTFGAVPLAGVLVNLIAIPFVYPILLFSLLCSVLQFFGLTALASAALVVANLFSGLNLLLAKWAAQLPFCSLATVFPSDFIPVALTIAWVCAATLLPLSVRVRCRVSVGFCAALAVSVGASLFISANSVCVASSAVSGTTVITTRGGSVVLDSAENDYYRDLDNSLRARLGDEKVPLWLVALSPYDSAERIAQAAALYRVTPERTLADPPPEPMPLAEGVTIRSPSPYVTEITVGSTKVMKYYAVYDIITRYEPEPPEGDTVLIDFKGNMLSVGGRRYLLRRSNGNSYLRIFV